MIEKPVSKWQKGESGYLIEINVKSLTQYHLLLISMRYLLFHILAPLFAGLCRYHCARAKHIVG